MNVEREFKRDLRERERERGRGRERKTMKENSIYWHDVIIVQGSTTPAWRPLKLEWNIFVASFCRLHFHKQTFSLAVSTISPRITKFAFLRNSYAIDTERVARRKLTNSVGNWESCSVDGSAVTSWLLRNVLQFEWISRPWMWESCERESMVGIIGKERRCNAGRSTDVSWLLPKNRFLSGITAICHQL